VDAQTRPQVLGKRARREPRFPQLPQATLISYLKSTNFKAS